MDKAAEVLAQLREERARLAGELAGVERAITALEQALVEKAPVAAPPAAEPEPPPVTLPPPAPPVPPPPPGPYRSLGFYEAAALYLREAGEPRTPRQIAEALLAGDYRTDSANLHAVARAMLGRSSSAEGYGIRSDPDGRYRYEHTPDSDATA